MDSVKLPKFVRNVLSLGSKHPIRENFNEMHFLPDVDRLIFELRRNNTEDEGLCEKKSAAKWYAKNVPETPMDRGFKKFKVFDESIFTSCTI